MFVISGENCSLFRLKMLTVFNKNKTMIRFETELTELIELTTKMNFFEGNSIWSQWHYRRLQINPAGAQLQISIRID